MHRLLNSIVVLAVAVAPAFAQPQDGREPVSPPTVAALAPARSADGRLLAIAVEATTPVKIDGAFDDEVWQRAQPIGHFVQSEPKGGEPATEPTEVRVAFDGGNLYIAATLHDGQPGMGIVNDIKKDFQAEDQDTFEVIIDTFADRRNGFMFTTNRGAARADQQVANEGREINRSWDAVWFVRTRQNDDGWTVEMAIPFKSLRFTRGAQDGWGINFSRRIRRKNEVDFWSPVPRAYALTRLSLAGNLAGLSSVSPGRNLQIKPYAMAKTVRPTGAGTAFDRNGAIGLDMKYGVTPSLTLDATANPDFAQVEADELTVNLTRFSTFYQEKRNFFLENSGIFYVGDASRNNRVNPTPTPDEDLLIFHSRRIGLRDDGTPIPIYGGARLTGRAGGVDVGLLSMQVQDAGHSPNNNYTVLRARKNVRSGSDIGAIFMTRQSTDDSGDYNRVYGVDANIRFFGTTDWNSYAIKTSTPGYTDGQYAWRTTLNREGNFLHLKGGVMSLGDHFNDELGYYRRVDARKWLVDAGIRPRPKWWQEHGVRELHPHIVWSYFTDHTGHMTGKNLHTGFTFFFNNGGYTELLYNPKSDEIRQPLTIASGAPPVPPGLYTWNEYQIKMNTDPSRKVTLALVATMGGLYSGTQRTIHASVELQPSYRLRIMAGVNRTSGQIGPLNSDFVTGVWTARLNYSFTTNMFLDSLAQFDQDKHRFNANIRFNFIHHPLSDLYLVYNEQQITNDRAVSPGRSVIVKFTRMMAF